MSMKLGLAVILLGCTGMLHAQSPDRPAPRKVTKPPVPSIGTPPGYQLVWQDEFDKKGLPDPANWSYDTEANATGWYNHEKQYYAVANPKYSRVANGRLIITARKAALVNEPDYGGQHYTSARLISIGKAEWTYGFFEIRAKLPCGRGTWPAIWMLGSANVAYPLNGEIDIMEQVGSNPTEIDGTIHTKSSEGTFGNGSSTTVDTACTRFHNYQLTWTSKDLTIGVDGTPYYVYHNNGKGVAQWPFDKPQYLLLNLAMGGDAGGAIDDAALPRRMEVDYVRVFQLPKAK